MLWRNDNFYKILKTTCYEEIIFKIWKLFVSHFFQGFDYILVDEPDEDKETLDDWKLQKLYIAIFKEKSLFDI